MNDRPSLHTPLCDLLECEYPIIQAGMGGVARSELAAAISSAGGLGCLGMVRETPELITQEIARVRKKTDRPFAVNLIPAATDKELFDSELKVCLEASVHTIIYFWDVVPSAVEKAKSAGCKVLYQVGSMEAALDAETAGADAVIAQGNEAGGHVHGHVSSLVLLPEIAKALNIPVIGSGGFASGASLLAALTLGAQGIHCGTVFIPTHESFAHDIHKQQVIAARSVDTVYTDAFAINWPPGSPVRVLESPVTQNLGNQLLGHDPQELGREKIAEEQGRPIYLYSTDSPLRTMVGNLERLAMFGGQVSGHIDKLRSASEVVADIVREARSGISRLNNTVFD